MRRVNREIKILKKARHGNIIQLYEVLDTPNTIYLMMENAEGGEMFDYIVAHRYVPELQACKFFHQIVDGVDMLHKNDITHRDLKPENLLLKHSSDGWIVKIVDFGLSNTHEGGKLLSTACGSPCYAAPEMIAGKQYNGPGADIWSMGVILFALVCGFLPFEDQNTSSLYRKILAGEYKPAKWISSDVKDLIRRILEVDPRRRYTVEDIRKHPWYNLALESSIPRDESETEKVKSETISAMAAAGMDVQAVLDAVQSRTCNSMTAMYYLLAQKSRANKKMGNLDKDKMQNLLPGSTGGHAKGEAGAGGGGGNKGGSKGGGGAAAQQVAPSSDSASGEHKSQGGVAPQSEPTQQRRSRTPTPTRVGVDGGQEGGGSASTASNGLAPRQPVAQQPQRPSPRAPPGYAAAVQQGGAYAQGGSSVLQKLQQQHQQRMTNTGMPSLDVYMGATGSGGEGGAGAPNRIGKIGVSPVVPKLNIRGGLAAGGQETKNGPPLISQTSRPRSGAGISKSTGASAAAMQQQQQQQQQQQPKAYTARDALPTDTTSFNMSALSSEIVAVPMPTDLLGPMVADIDSDRPSTRRSRSRQGGRGSGDERPQSAAGGLDVPNDRVTNAAPVTMHNADGSDATSTLRVVSHSQAAPDASKRSSASTGGRKGKHLRAAPVAAGAPLPEAGGPDDVFPDAPVLEPERDLLEPQPQLELAHVLCAQDLAVAAAAGGETESQGHSETKADVVVVALEQPPLSVQ